MCVALDVMKKEDHAGGGMVSFLVAGGVWRQDSSRVLPERQTRAHTQTQRSERRNRRGAGLRPLLRRASGKAQRRRERAHIAATTRIDIQRNTGDGKSKKRDGAMRKQGGHMHMYARAREAKGKNPRRQHKKRAAAAAVSGRRATKRGRRLLGLLHWPPSCSQPHPPSSILILLFQWNCSASVEPASAVVEQPSSVTCVVF